MEIPSNLEQKCLISSSFDSKKKKIFEVLGSMPEYAHLKTPLEEVMFSGSTLSAHIRSPSIIEKLQDNLLTKIKKSQSDLVNRHKTMGWQYKNMRGKNHLESDNKEHISPLLNYINNYDRLYKSLPKLPEEIITPFLDLYTNISESVSSESSKTEEIQINNLLQFTENLNPIFYEKTKELRSFIQHLSRISYFSKEIKNKNTLFLNIESCRRIEIFQSLLVLNKFPEESLKIIETYSLEYGIIGRKRWFDNSEIGIKEFSQRISISEFTTLKDFLASLSICIDGYFPVQKLNSGGWSDNYRLVPKDKPHRKLSKFLKIPAMHTSGSKNETANFSSSGEMIKVEEDLGMELSNTSLLTYSPNFNYLPVPQFQSSVLIYGDYFFNHHELRRKNSYSFKGQENIPMHKSLRCLIYEFIDGDTLKNISLQNDSSQNSLLQIATNAAYALNFVHLNVGIHNDIKSDNFMATKSGRVYILDLAFSKIQGAESSLRGSRAYTAPERLSGNTSPSVYSDMYGFGIVLHELFFKKLPIEVSGSSENKKSMTESIARGEKRVICPQDQKFNTDFYGDISSVIERCTNYDPSDISDFRFGRKFNSMQEVENELVRIQKQYSEKGVSNGQA